VQIVPPNETVVVIGFELKMGNRAGTMSLCIPYNVIEPIMGVLAAQNWFSYQRKGFHDDHVRKLTSNVSNAPVEVRGFLAQTTISVNDLLSLQPGDIITTDKLRTHDVLIQVEGKHKFLGQVGQLRGNRAIRITKLCRPAPEPTVPETLPPAMKEKMSQNAGSGTAKAADVSPAMPAAPGTDRLISKPADRKPEKALEKAGERR
jgi:flagellar motor switch protein FliM